MARPPQERAVQTRNAVLRAAGEAFAERGFRGTSMADIITRANVTKGAVYFHFPSKQALAQAVMETHGERTAAWLEEAIAKHSSPLQAVIEVSYIVATAIRTDSLAFAGIRLIVEQGTYEKRMAAPYGEWENGLAELLEKAREQGEIRRDVDTGECARFLVGAFTGTQLVSFIATRQDDLNVRLDAMWRLLLNGILPEGRSVILVPRAGS